MGWSKPMPNGFGGFRQERSDRGQEESLHGKNVKDDRIVGDRVHYHKGGMTITKGKQTYTVSRRYCGNCRKETMQRCNGDDVWHCLNCRGHVTSCPE